MGISWILKIRAASSTMKFLAVASALVACAAGSPQYLVGGIAGYPYALGYGLGLKSAPCAYGYGLGYYGKRDADADPALLYGAYAGYPYAYGVPFGSSTGLDPITQGLDASTQGYAPYAYGYGLGYYGKR